MKLRIATLAALAALSGQAFATNTAIVTAAEAAAAPDQLNISGSSAAKGIIAGLFSQNCTAGTLATFTGPSVSVPYAVGTISGGVGNVYACRASATNDWGLAEDTVIVLNKRDLLGSGHGVFPVAQNVAIEFTDLTSCSDADFKCTATVLKTPDAGISDEEPTLFNGTYNRPYAFTSAAPVANSDFGSVTSVFSQVFGVAVTTKLAAEMVAAGNYVTDANGNQIPSLSSTQIANLLSGTKIRQMAWRTITTTANQNAGVNVCTRDIGSGTRAAFNTLFLQNGAGGLSPFTAAPSQSNAAAPTDTNNTWYINEAGSGGGVVTCLDNVDGTLTKGLGIGILGLGTNTDAHFTFAAIDGVLPTRDNAKIGKYGAWVESTIQTNVAAAGVGNAGGGTLSAGALAFLKSFITKATYADNLGQVGKPAIAGVFALPLATSTVTAAKCSTYAGTYPVKGSSAVPATAADSADYFCSRFTRGGASTKTPAFAH